MAIEVPTAYTDDKIKQYMLSLLEGVGPSADWTTNNFNESVVDVLIDYGTTTVASCSDITKLRALARVHAWRKLASAVSGDFDFAADEAEYKRRVVYEHALRQLEEAERLAWRYLDRNQAETGSMTWEDDPYQSVIVYGRPYFGVIVY